MSNKQKAETRERLAVAALAGIQPELPAGLRALVVVFDAQPDDTIPAVTFVASSGVSKRQMRNCLAHAYAHSLGTVRQSCDDTAPDAKGGKRGKANEQ